MATSYQEAVEKTIIASEQLNQIVNGTATAEVVAEDGSKIPSIRKALVDNFYFKDPLPWQQGQSETVFNQLRKFSDGTLWYAPTATTSNVVTMGVTPVGDTLWVLYSLDAIPKLTPQIREALRRSYAGAGFNLVDGSFEEGGLLSSNRDVLLEESSGRAYTGPSGVVPSGTNPVLGDFTDQSHIQTLSFPSVLDMKTYNGFTIGQRVVWRGYYSESDGGSNWGIVKAGPHVEDGGSIFSVTQGLYVEANLKGNKISILKFGAKADSTQTTLNTNNAPMIQKLVDYLSVRGGGHVYTPAPQNLGFVYGIAKPNPNTACVTVTTNNFTFSGDGTASVWKTYSNDDVPLHFSSDTDLTKPAPSGSEVSNLEVYGMHIKGTGTFQYFSLAKGRGILFRNAKNVSIHDNWITDMSMIGICSEAGDGYFQVQNNQIHSCRYTGVNYNGRCYQSIISGNIISGCNANINSMAIQATGHSIISNNTVLGEVGNTVNCGGIMWGEGPYHGIGLIQGNLVKHVSFGILAIYHGSVSITGNTIINALNRSGILVSGGSTPSFTVESSDNLISSNLIINCFPSGIDSSSPNTLILGNKIKNIKNPINPSSSTQPDFIATTNTQQGIRIRASGCSVLSNQISGCVAGLTTTIAQLNGAIGDNQFSDNTYDTSIESTSSSIFALRESVKVNRTQVQSNTYVEQIFSDTRPTGGFFPLGSEWRNPSPKIGSPVGQIVLFAEEAITTSPAGSGDSQLVLNSAARFLSTGAGTVCGIELDNKSWHWTTVTNVSVNTITLGAPIPSGRTVLTGAKVLFNAWRNLATLS